MRLSTACVGILLVLTVSSGLGASEPASDHVAYMTVKGSKNLDVNDDNIYCCVIIDWQYPEFIAGAKDLVIDSLNSFVRHCWPRHFYGDSTMIVFDEWVDEQLSLVIMQRRRAPRLAGPGHSQTMSIRVGCNAHGLIGLVCHSDGYWGGAHGHSFSHFFNFDLETGRLLSLADIVGSEAIGDITRVGESEFRKMRRLDPNEPISERFDFPNDVFELNGNFSIDSTGLFFFYNDYEIAGYAAGNTKVTIPWDSLAAIVDSTERLRPFVDEHRK